MPDKLLLSDVAPILEATLVQIRQGFRKIRDDNVAIVQIPDKVDFNFTVIIRKDDLQRLEITSRDATTTTTTTGTSTETEQKSAATSITDETEQMVYTRVGGEIGGETGGETGGASGTQSGGSQDIGEEVETYVYEPFDTIP